MRKERGYILILQAVGHNMCESWKIPIFTVKNQGKLLSGTPSCYLIWGRVFDCAGKGFGFSGDIFTPAR